MGAESRRSTEARSRARDPLPALPAQVLTTLGISLCERSRPLRHRTSESMLRLLVGFFCVWGLAAKEVFEAPAGMPQAARGEEEVEAAEMAEVEVLRTELLQMKVSSAGTFDDVEETTLLQADAKASVVIDDLADFPTMFVQTDMELATSQA
eukprot:s5856_g2.t1